MLFREPVKKKCGKFHIWGGGGGGPDRVIFHIFFFKKKKNNKNKVVFKMHFKPFQAILDNVFSTFMSGYPQEK